MEKALENEKICLGDDFGDDWKMENALKLLKEWDGNDPFAEGVIMWRKIA